MAQATLPILVLFLWLEYASEVPVFSLPSFPGMETQDPWTATRSAPVSDREKAGLRGPVRKCIEESNLPDGSKYSTASEYSPDGSLLTTRMGNPDGSEWITSRTYHAEGRLAKVVSGGWRILNRLRYLRVAYPLRFCFLQRVGDSLLRFSEFHHH